MDKAVSTKTSFYDKERTSSVDEKVKFKLIALYNKELDRLADKYTPDIDIAVIADVLLDIYRHKTVKVLDA